MHISGRLVVVAVGLGIYSQTVPATRIPDTAASSIIEKDVVIVGGGASGAHAAVRLREDYGKSIVIIEKQDNLGGHVETYIDPVSGKPYDYGVNSYTEYGAAEEFFSRFNISLQTPTRLTLTTTYADFNTGKVLDGYVAPLNANVTAGLQKYLEICEQYEDLIIPSYANFPTEDIPEDLLLKFGDFVTKYGLEAIVPRVFQVTGLGLGNVVDELTLYVMQAFGAPIVRTFLGLANSWVPTTKRNQDLYDNIATLLGEDVLYSTTVIRSHRSSNGTQLLVQDSNGKKTLLKAKRLLVSLSPTAANTRTLDLDQTEQSIFAEWGIDAVFAGIANHPSLPVNYSIVNYPASVIPSNWLELPETPFVGRFEYLGDSNFRVLATGTEDYDIAKAQALAQDAFDKLVASGTIANATQGQPLSFPAFAAHIGIHPHVSVDELQSGFYQRLYALQGRRSTFFTGGAWAADFTTILWEYNNQYLLPKLLGSL
ncbi:amine oxidase [Truncatella angustata]|uniref:Amine oxidase n=1 Tax=Truncatella angustata TaxID=152316 RepID=A0A9P8UPG8_9PEZI|nr:amine oxidase [Truncatella angustata]KAH6655669.1 amine oxidase [Truncatella angustata]